jgi:peptide/nickel transport system permease protein
MKLLIQDMPWSARIAFVAIAGYFVVAITAPWIAPFPQTTVVGPPFAPAGGQFLLGTDNLGRDVLSRLIYAARNTLGIAMAISLLSFAIGSTLGLLSAAVEGWFDWALARFVDIVMSIPPLVSALLVLSVVGTDLPILIATIALLDATKIYRLSRAMAQGIMAMDYVQVATLRRERIGWVMFREVLPNALAPLLAEFGVRFCYVFLFISGLSFLGLGIQPPAADWGSMVRDNASLIIFGDPIPLLPAMALAVLAVSVNFVVDWFVRRSCSAKM